MAGQTRIYDPKRIKRMAFIVGHERLASMVKAATGCSTVLNASFYGSKNGELVPTFHLKSEDYILADQTWKCYGMSWNSKDLATTHDLDYGMRLVMDADHDTCISGYILLAPNADMSVPLDKNIPSRNVKRGRTLLGVNAKGEIIIHVVGDGDAESMTATQCRQKMYDLGCTYAIMLDGGGSSQADFEDGTRIYASRQVYNFLAIWLYTDEEYDAIYGTDDSIPEKTPTMIYRVQVGAFTVKENAVSLKDKLKNDGYDDAFITTAEVNGRVYNRVQLGAFTIRENAEKLEAELEEKGYSAFIQAAEVVL